MKIQNGRENSSRKIRAALAEKSICQTLTKYIIAFPDLTSLLDHAVGEVGRSIYMKCNQFFNFVSTFFCRTYFIRKNSLKKKHCLFQAGGDSQRIDSLLAENIEQFVKEGVKNVNKMKRHLITYVKSEMFVGRSLPSKNSKRFFPRQKTIRSPMVEATKKVSIFKN